MYLLCITCKTKWYVDFQSETYGLSSLTTSFIYGLQNDPMIDIIIIRDFILILNTSLISSLEFKDFVACQL
jgi:hypothetical protein